MFGLALLNDWSARDIQAWEYQPLGPFLSKNFATHGVAVDRDAGGAGAVSPALRAGRRAIRSRCPTSIRRRNRDAGAIDIELEVWLQTEAMRAAGQRRATPVARSNFARLPTGPSRSWSRTTPSTAATFQRRPARLRHAVGPEREEAGSLLELTQGGKQPIRLANGETRTFLEDGDTVILRGWCEGPGHRRIGFGECRGTVLPAREAVGAYNRRA